MDTYENGVAVGVGDRNSCWQRNKNIAVPRHHYTIAVSGQNISKALRHVEEAPQLPTGYAGMIVLAWFPPLWRRVMDPRLLDHFGGDVSRANIHPRKRARVLARYGAAPEAVS